MIFGGFSEASRLKHLRLIKELGFYYELVHLMELQREECLKNIMNTDFYRKYSMDFPKSYISHAPTPSELEKWKDFKPDIAGRSNQPIWDAVHDKLTALQSTNEELEILLDAAKSELKKWFDECNQLSSTNEHLQKEIERLKLEIDKLERTISLMERRYIDPEAY